MFLGIHEVGQLCQILEQCKGPGGQAVDPSNVPSYVIYDSDGNSVETGNLGSSNHDSKTGLRRTSFTLSSGTYSTGLYVIRTTWDYGGKTYARLQTMQIA